MAAVRDFAQTKDGLKLRYEIRGKGEPVALIMGFSGSGRGWGEPFLKLMEARFKIFMIDNRGTGESDKPDTEFTLGDMAADIAAVLDHAKIAARAHFRNLDGRDDRAGIRARVSAAHARAGARMHQLRRESFDRGRSGGNSQPDTGAGMDPIEQARRAFSVACGKAFLDSEAGQATLDSGDCRDGQLSGDPDAYVHAAGQAIGGFDSFDAAWTNQVAHTYYSRR